jgi:hypothetical protein
VDNITFSVPYITIFLSYCLFNYLTQVTGKAVMLDEIINYVQSLQRQVEVPVEKYVSFSLRPLAPFSPSYIYIYIYCNKNLTPSLSLSLQFLSMKLATVNPQLDFNTLPNLLPKDVSCSLMYEIFFLVESS